MFWVCFFLVNGKFGGGRRGYRGENISLGLFLLDLFRIEVLRYCKEGCFIFRDW